MYVPRTRLRPLPNRRSNQLIALLLCAVLLTSQPLAAESPAPAGSDTTKLVRQLTGAPTRAVWIQDAGETACVMSERPTLRLIGFDSEDGKGERAIVPDIRRYAKPLLSADGQRVFFGDKEAGTVCVVGFDGKGFRTLVSNASFDDVWTDPRTGVEWVYATVKEKRGAEEIPVVRRFRVDKPEVSELVWDKMPISQFMLSGDGRLASGGGDGGNSPQGVLTLPNGTFTQRAGGCWPSMSPDTSHRMWVFTGSHRSIHFFTPTNKSGTAYNEGIRFDQTPGITLKGREEVYHPRWSNNIRFFAVTSPLSEWSYKAEAKIPNNVAENVEIYLGKFAPDMKTVERFVPISANKRGDYWPDVWIKPSDEQLAELTKGTAAPPPADESLAKAPDSKGLVYVWDTGAQGNQIADAKTGAIRQCGGQFRGEGRFGRYHVMDLHGGSWVADGADSALLEGVKTSKSFAVEAILTPDGPVPPEEAPKVIFSFADKAYGQPANVLAPAQGNMLLEQRGEWLAIRLRSGKSAELSQPIPLVRLMQGVPQHIVVSLTPEGRLACTLDGARVILPDSAMPGKAIVDAIAAWTPQHLCFGDTYLPDPQALPASSTDSGSPTNWRGQMEGVAILSRAVSESEARQRYAMALEKRGGSLAAAAAAPTPEPLPPGARKPIDTIVVEAKLTGTCPPADPKGIAPYKRNLSIQKYEIQRVIKGRLDEKEITVAQWSVLDGQVVPAYTRLAAGQTYTLALEAWEARPEQESERSLSGNFDGDALSLFYEVRPPAASTTSTAALPALDLAGPVATTRPMTVGEVKAVPGASAPALSLGAPLTIAGSETPLALSEKSEFRLNGQPLLLSNSSLRNVALAGTVRLGGNGSVAAATVVDGGTGYLQAPRVVFTTGSPNAGAGASAEAVMGVAHFDLTAVGSGFTTAPHVVVAAPDTAGGRTAQGRAFLDKAGGTISRVEVTDAGTGYTRPPRVTLRGGGGKDAMVEATLCLTGIVMTNGGKGYTAPPAITLQTADGQGSGAQAIAATQLTTMRYTDTGASCLLTSSGTVDQDGAAIIWDWASSVRNTGNRGFTNRGTWTMKQGAVLQLVTASGMSHSMGGTNAEGATLRVLSRSRIGVSRLENSGTLELGNGAVVGHPDFAAGEASIVNKGAGEIAISGDEPIHFGFISEYRTGKRRIDNGSTASDKATFILGNGKDKPELITTGGEVEFANAAGSTVAIRSNATMSLITNDNGSNHAFNSRTAKVENSGSFHLAGTLRVQGNHGGFTGIDNAGNLCIEGTTATIERLRNSSGPGGVYHEEETSCRIVNKANANLSGNGMLSYINSTSRDAGRFLRIINSGTITPGIIQENQNTSSAGKLTLHNVNLRFGNLPAKDKNAPKEKRDSKTPPPRELAEGVDKSGGTLRIRIAGPAGSAQSSDLLALTSDTKPEQGPTGEVELLKGAGSRLDIVTRNGARPKGTYRILTATGGMLGTFDLLAYNGRTDSVPYTVQYGKDYIDVVFP
ncbi:hypothetical protein DB346_05170 [Verrucomicrobia bacterium LW23]|nr:hypothetical protein DB346_05170 [Verrucomicrobia bacterium LW23]